MGRQRPSHDNLSTDSVSTRRQTHRISHNRQDGRPRATRHARTRKFIRDPLLGRKQMVVDILHPNRANISKDELRGKLAEMYKANKDQVNVFGLQTQFGGGKTTGFALVYDSPEALKKFEPHYRWS